MSEQELNTCKKCNSLHEGNGDLCGHCQDNLIERLEKIVEDGHLLGIAAKRQADGFEAEIESLKRAMRIHAGDICSANNEADRFIDMNRDLEDENQQLRGSLKHCQSHYKGAKEYLEVYREIIILSLDLSESEQVLLFSLYGCKETLMKKTKPDRPEGELMSRLSEPQKEFGHSLVTEYSVKHGITYLQAVKILLDTREFFNIWKWVNCDTFLNESDKKSKPGGD